MDLKRTLIRHSFGVLLLASVSCVQPFIPPEGTVDISLLVVDGFVNTGGDTTYIKLSRTAGLADTDHPALVNNASVYIQGTDFSFQPLTSIGNGRYIIAPSVLKLESGVFYRLGIGVEGKQYVSDYTTALYAPKVDSVYWREDVDGLRYFIDTHDEPGKTNYYRWDFDETWRYGSIDISIYQYLGDGKVVARKNADSIHYCWNTAHSTHIHVGSGANLQNNTVSGAPLWFIEKHSPRLYFAYKLIVNQRLTTADGLTYYDQLEKNSNNEGTLFAPTPSRLTGNIHSENDPTEDVIGWVDFTSVTHYSVKVLRQEITGPHEPYDMTTGYESCKKGFIPIEDFNDETMAGLDIVNQTTEGRENTLVGYIVATKECLDCRLMGGTLDEPK